MWKRSVSERSGGFRRRLKVVRWRNGSRSVVYRGPWRRVDAGLLAAEVLENGTTTKMASTTPDPCGDSGMFFCHDQVEGDWPAQLGLWTLVGMALAVVVALLLHYVCNGIFLRRLNRREQAHLAEAKEAARKKREDTAAASRRPQTERTQLEEDWGKQAQLRRDLRETSDPRRRRQLRAQLECLVFEEVEPHIKEMREIIAAQRLKTKPLDNYKAEEEAAPATPPIALETPPIPGPHPAPFPLHPARNSAEGGPGEAPDKDTQVDTGDLSVSPGRDESLTSNTVEP